MVRQVLFRPEMALLMLPIAVEGLSGLGSRALGI